MKLNLANKSKTGIFYGWVIVAAGCLILLVQVGCQHSYGVFFTELCRDLNWTRAMVSGAFSLGFFWHGIIYFVAGSLNDRHGPRLAIAVSALVMGLGYALMSVIKAPWQLYMFYGIIIGTGFGFGFLPVISTASRWFVRRRGTALGLTVAGVGIGTLVLAPFAQFLITKFDWRTSYLILAGLVVVIVLPLSRLMRLDPSEKGLLPYGRGEIATENEQLGNSLSSEVSFSLKQATRTSQFWLLSVMYASYPFAVQMVMVHLKAYAVDFGIAEMTAATALGLVGAGGIVGRVVTGSLSDKIGRKACFFVAYLVMAVMLLWLIKARQPWQFYLFSIAFGFGHGSLVPLFPAVIGDWFGTKAHGSIFGMLGIGLGIGGAIGPLLAGYIYDVNGSYDVAIIAGAVVLFIALGCSFAIKAPYEAS
jgi:MFS family permease